MLRTFSFLLLFFLSVSALSAQTEPTAAPRLAVQDLSAAEADQRTQTLWTERFSSHLSWLKQSIQEKNATLLITSESKILDDMRHGLEYVMTKSGNEGLISSAAANQAIQRMNDILNAFDNHSIDLANAASAQKDIALLEAFLEQFKTAVAGISKKS